MNKILTKVTALCVGLAMVAGVGVAVGSKKASEAKAADVTYNKITSLSDLVSGSKYLIVYEAGNVAFDGSRTTFDAVGNTKAVTISSNSITTSESCYFVFSGDSTNGYSIQGSSGKYINQTSNANGLVTSDEAVAQTVSFDDNGSVLIACSAGAILRYNSASNQTRFRYFKTASYAGQQPVHLYKASGDTPVCDHEWVAGTVVQPTCTEKGYTPYTCSKCGANKQDDEVAALGHDYGSVIVDTAATCTEPGVGHQVCSRDSSHVLENVAIPATGHNFVNGVCTVCGASESDVAQYALFSGAIEEGDYIIYYDGYAMNTTVTSDRLQYETVTPSDDVISDPSSSIVWHIAPSGDYWTLYNEEAEAYAASTGAKNKAQMLEDGTDDKSLWSITGSETYEFVNKQNTSSAVNANLRKNGTYGFACYATSTGGALSLYKSSGSTPTTSYTVTDNVENGTLNKTSVKEGATLVVTIAPDTGYVVPESVTVYEEGVEKTHEYSGGVVTVQDVQGNIVIEGTCGTAPAEKGTADNPYTVAEARAKIDNTPGTTTWYATGIVSQIVTPYNTQYSNITFNFSDDGTTSSPQLQAYRCGGTEAANIAVGDIVIVSGKLKKYNSTYEFDSGCTIVSRTEPAVTKFTVTGNIDNGSINVSEIAQGATLEARVCGNLGYFYPDTLTSVKVNGSDVPYTYNNGVVTITNVQGNVVISGACVACSAVKSIYAMDKGVATGTFYAYYAGFLTGTGPVFMDGEYGIVVYNKEFNPSELTEKETVCAISGTTDNYNGLYQLKNATIEKASGEYPMPAAPVVYAVQGGETELFESRLTAVSGTVKSVEPKKSGQALWSNDTKVTMTVGSHDILCFAKASVFTTEEGAEIEAAVTSGDAITLKGFTGWYNGFQVTVNGRIQAADDYTAEEFAADLLQQTDAICVDYVDGESSYSEFKVALEAVWSDLASDDKYPSLPQDQKDILDEAERDESGTVVEQAMARYDFLTGKYSLSNFISGRTPIVPAGSYLPSYESNLSSSSSITIIVIVAVASMTLLGVTLVLRKRKHQ